MKKVSADIAKEKIRHFCAYQERHHQEVRSRLYSYGLHGEAVEEVITSLITDGYLNEERFARAYAGGKFRMKKWGRIKIAHALEAKGLSKNCIRAGLEEIADEDYLETLKQVLTEKSRQLSDENLFMKRDRLSKYAITKGYEPEAVWQLIRELFPD
jgi:regulatory protein